MFKSYFGELQLQRVKRILGAVYLKICESASTLKNRMIFKIVNL
jgi:hypothetical protein